MWFLIESNKRKTAVFLTVLTLIFVLSGVIIGYAIDIDAAMENGHGISKNGYIFTIAGLLISLILLLGIIIYVKLNSAKFFLDKVFALEIDKNDYPVLCNVIEEMSISAALGFVPKAYIVESKIPNAFAVGLTEKNSAIAVTTGLLSILNRDELQGVIAHEISHIKNRDTLYLMYAGVILGIVVFLSEGFLRGRHRRGSSRDSILILVMLVLAIVAPIFVKLLYFTISREREYLADACACQFTRYPSGLAGALKKISSFRYEEPNADEADLEDAGSNIWADEKIDEEIASGKVISAMCIHNFLQKKTRNSFSELFATHPSVQKRIAILKKMGACDIQEYNNVYSTVVAKKQLISKDNLLKINAAPLAIVVPAALAAENSENSKCNDNKEQISDNRIERQRKAKDAYKKAANYKIINCKCGVILKIPPELKINQITCPECGKVHETAL